MVGTLPVRRAAVVQGTIAYLKTYDIAMTGPAHRDPAAIEKLETIRPAD